VATALPEGDFEAKLFGELAVETNKPARAKTRGPNRRTEGRKEFRAIGNVKVCFIGDGRFRCQNHDSENIK
jgi:hypothetical protein